jgi:hypothetical protein
MGRNLLEIKNSSHMTGKQFINYVTQYLPKHYGRSDIYFMVNLNKLAEKFNALMYFTLGTGVLKSRLKQVEQVLRKEPDFWKHIPSGRSCFYLKLFRSLNTARVIANFSLILFKSPARGIKSYFNFLAITYCRLWDLNLAPFA